MWRGTNEELSKGVPFDKSPLAHIMEIILPRNSISCQEGLDISLENDVYLF